MSSLFGSKKSPPATSFNVQTSVQGLPIPKVWGKTRISGNLIYYGDFTSYKAGGGGGKGGIAGGGSSGKGGSGSSYNYQVAVAIGLCQGAIKSVDTVWADKSPFYPSQLGFTIFPGDFAQTPWGRLTSLHPDRALAYRGIAYVASFLYLGSSTQLPNLSFEVHATIADAISGTPDADPSAVITDFLTNPNDGVGLDATRVGDLTNYRNYCRATGMLISPSLASLTTGQDFLNTILEATNSEAVWSQGALQIVPRGDQAMTAGTIITVSEQHAVLPLVGVQLSFPGVFVADLGVANTNIAFNFTKVAGNPAPGQYFSPSPGLYGFNGADVGEVLTFAYSYTEPTSYTPPPQPLYSFTDDDYLTGGNSNSSQPVLISRSAPQDAKNSVIVNYTDRANSYALTPTPAAKDDAAIQAYGLKQDNIKDYHFFQYAQAAQMAAHLALGRNSVRNTYVFTVGQKYKLLDPADIVSITDAATGLINHWARILEITENSDASLTIMAEDYLSGTSAAPKYAAEANGGYTSNYHQDPGFINAPLIFEPPSTLTGGTNELWIAVSGSSLVWGGCDTYVSYDDTNYTLVADAHLVGPSRQGYATAALTIDPMATLSVNLAEVPGAQLTTVTAAEASSLATLCYLDGELLAYTTATLTGIGVYTLGGLIRGAYGTPVKAHAAGVQFARVDQNIIKVPYNKALIGGAIFLKFLSFNIWGNSEQTLSEVTEIEYTFGGGQPPGVITGIKASAVQSGLAMSLIASWSADGLSASYQAGISVDGGLTWQDVYDGSNLSTRADGLKATTSILFRVRGVTSSGIPGVYSSVPVAFSGITSAGSGYTEFLSYKDISASVIDAALLPDYNSDLAEISQFAFSVSQIATTTQALQTANSAAAGIVQFSKGQLPTLAISSITAQINAQTVALNQQIVSINSGLTSQIAQEAADYANLNSSITTLSQAYYGNAAFTTGISIAQAGINTSNAIKLDETAARESSDNDSGELSDFVNLVQQGKVATIRANQQAAAQSAIVVQQIASTTLIQANALYAITLASQVGASFAQVNQTQTTLTTAQQALAGLVTSVQSQLGDPVTGLSATYSDIVATSATVNDPSVGNLALVARTTSLSASVAKNSSDITIVQAVNATQDGTIANVSTTISSNYLSLSGMIAGNTSAVAAANANIVKANSAISMLSQTQASDEGTIASLSTTIYSNYQSLGAQIVSANSQITTLAQTQSNDEGTVASLSSTVSSNYTSLGNAVAATNGALGGTNQSVIANSANISSLTTTSANQAAAISTLQTTVQSNYASLSGMVGSLNAGVAQNSASIQSLNQTVSSQGGSLATLSSQVQSNYSSQGNLIQQNTSSITSLQQTASYQGGTIATLSTNIASSFGGGNMIANSDLMGGYDGWTVSFSNSSNTIVFNYAGFTPVNSLPGVLAGIIFATGKPTANDTIFWRSPMVPVTPGAIYELSFGGAFYGARAQVAYAQTLDTSGNAIANLFAGQGGRLGGGQNGDPANYDRVGGFVTIPAGVSYIALLAGTIADGSGTQCTGFITRPQIRVASPGQQVLSPYSPGTQANVQQINSSITNVAQTAANANETTALQISSLKSSFGAGSGGGNMIANSDMMGLDTYVFSSTSPATANHYLDYVGTSGQVGRYTSYLPTGAYASAISDLLTPVYSATAGQTYEASVAAENDNGNDAILYIEYLDASGNVTTGGQYQGASNTYTSDGIPASRIGGLSVAPATTVSVRLRMRQAADPVQSYVRFAQPMLRIASPNQTGLSSYQPGTQANVPAIQASITNTAQTAASANAATATQVSQLSTTLTNNLSSIYGSVSSIQSSQSTDEGNISSLQTTVSSNYSSLSNSLAATNGALGATNNNVTSASSSISSLQGTVANQGSTLATLQTTVSSNYSSLSNSLGTTNSNVASNSSSINTLSNKYGSLSSQVQNISAASAAGTANGQVAFSAQSAPSGVTARFAVTLNASGQQPATGGFALDLVGGAVNFTVQASTFRVENPNSRFVPFGIDSSGNLYLQGLTYIQSAIESATMIRSASTGTVVPIMVIDFQNGSITINDAS